MWRGPEHLSTFLWIVIFIIFNYCICKESEMYSSRPLSHPNSVLLHKLSLAFARWTLPIFAHLWELTLFLAAAAAQDLMYETQRGSLSINMRQFGWVYLLSSGCFQSWTTWVPLPPSNSRKGMHVCSPLLSYPPKYSGRCAGIEHLDIILWQYLWSFSIHFLL